MDIKIRDVDAGALQVLLEYAKKQKVSRNELLKRHIEDLAVFDGIQSKESDLDRTMNKVVDALEMTFNRLDRLEKRTEKMFILLCDVSGLDPMEVNQMLDNMTESNVKGADQYESSKRK